MSLEALAPDQRAVVQLVLQQERSYDDLAGLLGISTDAVRERAHAGLDRMGGAPGDLTDEERGEIADYLLGQQSVSRREATRELLSSSADARRWANRVSSEIGDVARSPLPGVPDAADEAEPEPEAPGPAAPAAVPGATTAPALVQPGDEPESDEAGAETTEEPATAPVRARPRPRPEPDRRPASRAPRGDRPRASKVGGALLLAGIALILAVVVIVLVNPGDDGGDGGGDGGDEVATTPTPTAEATPAAAGQIELRGVGGSEAEGSMTIVVTPEGQVQFQIEAQNVQQTGEGEAYAVWLTGGGEPKRLGFAPPVGEDGVLGVSGPREGDEETFPRDFSRARQVVVSRETSQDATEPGEVILRGRVPRPTG